MGRAQKLKKQRKIEKIEKDAKAKESQKMIFTTVASIILIVVGGFWLNNWYQNKAKTMENVQAIIHTNMGEIKLALDKEAAPKTVENFVGLAKKGDYDGTTFHRVIKDFMIQGGDPNSKDEDLTNDGMGGVSLWGGEFDDEINPKVLGLTDEEISQMEEQGYTYNFDLPSKKMEKGVIAMANSGPNTNGSQFFIVTESEQPHLDGKHTVFGKVISGMEIVGAIASVEVDESDQPKQKVIINSVEIIENAPVSETEPSLTQPNEPDNSLPISIGDIQVETKGEGLVDIEKVE